MPRGEHRYSGDDGETSAPGASRRREEILAAALEILAEHGYRGASTLAVARRARTSKETLYNWFGSKQGLFGALVAETARSMSTGGDDCGVPGDEPTPCRTLHDLGVRMLGLATSPSAVTITRAAISEAHDSPEFGRIIMEKGILALRGILVVHLERMRADGLLAFDETEEATDVFLGLLRGDLPVRCLMGQEAPPDPDAVQRRAERAVRLFLRLYGTARTT